MTVFSTWIKRLLLPIFLFSSLVWAENAMNSKINKEIEHIYRQLPQSTALSMQERLNKLSSILLGKPYLLNALGEGETGRFDQMPLYRFDAFDCETYVTTVLALAFASTPSSYQHCLQKIRYQDSQVDYLKRNHFTSLEWNQYNQKSAFLKDITTSIINDENKPVFLMASALIDKPSWYQHTAQGAVRIQQQENKENLIKELQVLGSKQATQQDHIPYIPLTALFNEKGEPNTHLFKQIPNGAIIEIVRPNWDLTEKIGTHLNVSHLGFAFWKNDQLIFREASLEYHQVVDVSLINYLRETRNSPTIKGINIQIVLPKQPLDEACNAF